MVKGQVKMYVCGMTVYDLCHIGHARSMIAFDIIQRWFKASDYQVTYVRNITDIDDKIIKRSLENHERMRDLTHRMIQALHEDSDALGVERPNFEPCATHYVGSMVGMISTLLNKGLAYQSGSDVNFSVRKFPGYGALSGKTLDELHAGERVAVLDGKDDPLDFVLWKGVKADDPDEAKFPASFGQGRPGWHIECSAMACELLGETFDIHGGGADLQFPHHENEIAQSTAANGQRPANYWIHNGFVNVDNEKMSKSLGNFFTIREVLKHYDAETLRFFIVRSHYRSPLNYSDVHLNDARASLKRLYTALDLVSPLDSPTPIDWINPYAQRFQSAMNEDFATPEAVSVLFDLASEVNRTKSSALATLLKQLGAVLGLLQAKPADFLQSGGDQDTDWIEEQIQARAQAKLDKNYHLADAIRAQLLEKGVLLKDSPSGTTWEQLR